MNLHHFEMNVNEKHQSKVGVMRPLLIAAIVLLVGCSKSPDCSTDDTKTLVSSIVLDEAKRLAPQTAATIKVTLDSMRTTNKNESIGRYECAASMVAEIGPDTARQKLTTDVAYSVQPTDDGKQIYAELQGAHDLAVDMVIKAKLALEQAEQQAASAAQSEASVPAPSPTPVEAQPDAAGSEDECDLACQEVRLGEADTTLNDVYKEVRAGLTPEGANTLKKEQREWIKERDVTCAKADALATKKCLTDMTIDRVTFLRSY